MYTYKWTRTSLRNTLCRSNLCACILLLRLCTLSDCNCEALAVEESASSNCVSKIYHPIEVLTNEGMHSFNHWPFLYASIKTISKPVASCIGVFTQDWYLPIGHAYARWSVRELQATTACIANFRWWVNCIVGLAKTWVPQFQVMLGCGLIHLYTNWNQLEGWYRYHPQ